MISPEVTFKYMQTWFTRRRRVRQPYQERIATS